MTLIATDPVRERAVTPADKEVYDREGYVLLRGLISPAEAAALRAEVLSIMDVIGLGNSKLRQSHEYLADSALEALVNSPRLRQVASDLMGGPGSLYLPFTAVKSGRGGGEFNFHQDNQYTRFDGPGINLWCALNPMTVDNGCLQIEPRSHLTGTHDAEILADGHRKTSVDPKDCVPILMEAGDVVAFSRLTVHGSGPNTTDAPRVAYAVQYHRDDVQAVWDNQPPRLLKGASRWNIGPVKVITPPTGRVDGH